jgi:hypothetical protein
VNPYHPSSHHRHQHQQHAECDSIEKKETQTDCLDNKSLPLDFLKFAQVVRKGGRRIVRNVILVIRVLLDVSLEISCEVSPHAAKPIAVLVPTGDDVKFLDQKGVLMWA